MYPRRWMSAACALALIGGGGSLAAQAPGASEPAPRRAAPQVDPIAAPPGSDQAQPPPEDAAPAQEPSPTAPAQAEQPPEPTEPAERPPVTHVGIGSLKGADLRAQTIEAANPASGGAASPAYLIKLSVWLDRAHNSPGEIDGRFGGNVKEALATYEGGRHLPGEGQISPQALAALSTDKAPITQRYAITQKDEAGPFIGHLPSDFYAQSKLKRMGYLSPEQELAERFHMSMSLLEAMNPGADFTKAGTTLTVLNIHAGPLPTSVAKIEVDKTSSQVRALGADGTLVASFPATIGSTERPAPSGTWAVAEVRKDPAYTYDPQVLTWGPKWRGRFTIKPGPNNPTGVVWIAVTKPTYGIHGTPNAGLVGKTASHGCVRLTNWDAWDLGLAVSKGVPIVFMGEKPVKG
ncbi:MAG TPA: L,D-transpeptidase family protein [Caulobacteraceae bacterium]|jgi:lipoprotein-anchoring transpeptidase ErfK/SrfK|nr:L,D-transpeptidase family protein [Caulobacteraceae bacterium]